MKKATKAEIISIANTFNATVTTKDGKMKIEGTHKNLQSVLYLLAYDRHDVVARHTLTICRRSEIFCILVSQKVIRSKAEQNAILEQIDYLFDAKTIDIDDLASDLQD